MAQRDKNGETASQRIARKFIAKRKVNECNTVSINHTEFNQELYLYNSQIATLLNNKLYIKNNHDFSGSRLTKERKHALRIEAKRHNIEIVEDV